MDCSCDAAHNVSFLQCLVLGMSLSPNDPCPSLSLEGQQMQVAARLSGSCFGLLFKTAVVLASDSRRLTRSFLQKSTASTELPNPSQKH